MINDDVRARLRQVKMDALCGRNIHTRRLARLRVAVRIVDVLTIVVPILWFAPQLLAEQTWAPAVNAIGTCLTVVLLALGVWKAISQWETRIRTHAGAIAENVMVKHGATQLIDDDSTTDDRATGFLQLAQNIEARDTEVLADMSEKERQRAYRLALREVEPRTGNPACPQCGANPWVFEKGSCQLCGNLPRATQ